MFSTKHMIVPINNNRHTLYAGDPLTLSVLLHVIEGLFNNFLGIEMLFTVNCL
jgi:hypothetical protein